MNLKKSTIINQDTKKKYTDLSNSPMKKIQPYIELILLNGAVGFIEEVLEIIIGNIEAKVCGE